MNSSTTASTSSKPTKEEIVAYGAFEEFANIQKYLEENGYEIVSAEFERIPHELKEVTDEQRAQIEKLLDKFEDDEDVQNVFHKHEGSRLRRVIHLRKIGTSPPPYKRAVSKHRF